jgi:hypothetical protein
VSDEDGDEDEDVLEVEDDADAGEGLPLLLSASAEGPNSVAVVSMDGGTTKFQFFWWYDTLGSVAQLHDIKLVKWGNYISYNTELWQVARNAVITRTAGHEGSTVVRWEGST